jgi:ethanolamine-phosphate cytidylyltransferase
VGVHSDESIMENKGPTVMRMDERYAVLRLSRGGDAD